MSLSQSPQARLLEAFFWTAVLMDSSYASPIPMSIDDPRFTEHFANETTVPLEVASSFAGTGWNIYPWFDIQSRIGSYIVPLFLLIGSFQFAPLGFRNTITVTLHLISDPIGSLSCLLTTLATHQQLYDECQRLKVPRVVRKPISMILAAYVDWATTLSLLEDGNRDEDLRKRLATSVADVKRSMEDLFHDEQLPRLREARIRELQDAAKELSDSRVNGLGKITIGTINYLVSLGLAFTHIYNGDFNNRTGHSIALAMLFSWLIVAVFLSSIVGGFKTKRTARTVLERLQRHLNLIEAEEKRKLWPAESQPSGFSKILRPQIFKFHLIADNKHDVEEIYRSLEGAGGVNFSLNPRMLHQGWRNDLLTFAATFSVSISAAIACWISATNPTSGVGCRSIQQLSFLAAWAVSASITVYYRKRYQGGRQVLWTSIKDLLFCLAFACFFGMGFIGWFNSTFCWSAWFSRLTNALIVVNPGADIQKLAKSTWPPITSTVIAFHLLFILGVFYCFWDGVRLYAMSDKEHESYHPMEKSGESDRLERIYSESHPFLSETR